VAMRQPISLRVELEQVGCEWSLQWNSTSGETTIGGAFFKPPASVLFGRGSTHRTAGRGPACPVVWGARRGPPISIDESCVTFFIFSESTLTSA
jgi:hypothetical protein